MMVSSRGTQTSPIRRRAARVASISVLRRIVSIENGRSIVRECCTKPRKHTILGSDVLQSCSQTLLTNPSDSEKKTISFEGLECSHGCMSKVLSLPHTKYNNRFIKVKCTITPRQFLDESVTIAKSGRHWSLVLTSSVR